MNELIAIGLAMIGAVILVYGLFYWAQFEERVIDEATERRARHRRQMEGAPMASVTGKSRPVMGPTRAELNELWPDAGPKAPDGSVIRYRTIDVDGTSRRIPQPIHRAARSPVEPVEVDSGVVIAPKAQNRPVVAAWTPGGILEGEQP